MIDPIKLTTAKSADVLDTTSMDQLLTLQKYMFQDQGRPRTVQEVYGDNLMMLFRKDPFMAHESGYKTVTETDVQTYGSEQPEGSAPNLLKYGIGRTLVFSYTDYGQKYIATERFLRDTVAPQLFARAIDLQKSLINRRYLDGVHQFTFADSASYVNKDGRTVSMLCVDGLAPIHATHTLPHSSSTWTNVITGNPLLTKAGVLIAADLFRTNIKDGYGVTKAMVPTHVVTTNNATVMYNAKQLFMSSTDSTQTNSNVINALPQFTHVALPLLDSDANGNIVAAKKDRWFMLSLGADRVDVRYCEAVPISLVEGVYDKADTGNFSQRVKGSWAFKWVSGRGAVMSTGV